MAHEPLATVVGQLVSMGAEQGCNLGLDGLRQQRSRAVAQNLGQRISKSSWLGDLETVSVGHGVPLLRGGSTNPHDTPPSLFKPSPTFAHSSSRNCNRVYSLEPVKHSFGTLQGLSSLGALCH